MQTDGSGRLGGGSPDRDSSPSSRGSPGKSKKDKDKKDKKKNRERREGERGKNGEGKETDRDQSPGKSTKGTGKKGTSKGMANDMDPEQRDGSLKGKRGNSMESPGQEATKGSKAGEKLRRSLAEQHTALDGADKTGK